MIKREFHNKTRTAEYNSWINARRRCYDKRDRRYSYYGGRGIEVCDRWKNSFRNFLEDMGEKPSKNYSLDRIDNNGNYEPSNCRWATPKVQNNNSRNNRFIIYQGQKKTISTWSLERGIKRTTLRMRIDVYKWPLNKALGY